MICLKIWYPDLCSSYGIIIVVFMEMEMLRSSTIHNPRLPWLH